MLLEEVKLFLSYFGAFGIGGVVAFLLLKSFLPSYLAQKAQNLATKEDIAQITNEIERVRTQYVFLLEELKARHQLRLAAVEHRLQVHQEAYALWRKLIFTSQDSIHNVVIECQDWWNNNCLYLSPEAREAFSDAYFAAYMHDDLLKSRPGAETIKANWNKVKSAGEKILRAVELPPLGDRETEIVPAAQSESNPALNVAARHKPTAS